jgi:hypothetical protein
MYPKDSENSKPRYNPAAMNSRPSRNQTCGTLSKIGVSADISRLTGCRWLIETRKCPPRRIINRVSFTKRAFGS